MLDRTHPHTLDWLEFSSVLRLGLRAPKSWIRVFDALSKRLLLCLLIPFALILFCAGQVPARPLELESRISESAGALKDIMSAPDRGIPSDLLRRSRAVVIFPSVIKAGLGVGGQYGRGIVLRRNPPAGKWGPPAFVTLIGGSFGWQVGVQATDLVLLVMSDLSLRSLFRDKFTIGADASVAAGPIGRDASASTDIALTAGILSYSRAKGLYAGLSLQGSVMQADWEANEKYYGSDLSVIDSFFEGKGPISPAAAKLIELLNKYSR
jgi:lipid-binding SYLF domain-containing protein